MKHFPHTFSTAEYVGAPHRQSPPPPILFILPSRFNINIVIMNTTTPHDHDASATTVASSHSCHSAADAASTGGISVGATAASPLSISTAGAGAGAGIGSAFASTHAASPAVTAPSSAAAAAAAVAQGMMMTVSTVHKEARAKSPIISTANQVNAKTTAKKKTNKSGEVAAAIKTKEPRIFVGNRVFSLKSKLITIVKQGDPQYNIINDVGNGFRFYGTVARGDSKKGWWHIEYDLFPADHKCLRVSRSQCTTIAAGQDEPPYDPRHEKVQAVIDSLEILDDSDPEDLDVALLDSSDDDDDDGYGATATAVAKKKTKKKKKSRKVISIESFLAMSDEGALAATTFDHYYGEGDNEYIRWTILKDGEEISEDVMTHPSEENITPFNVDIPWAPETTGVDYFDTFFKYFFPSLEGKAAVIDKYLSNPQCSGHASYWVNEKVRFHRPDKPDPDYIVSAVVPFCI